MGPPKHKTAQAELKHHLSEYARNLLPSPLKELPQYLEPPGTICLSSGSPNPENYPFLTLSADTLVPDATRDEPERTSSFVISWLRKVFGKEARDEQKLLLMPRYPKAPKELTMTAILQYAPAAGLPSLNTMLHEFTSRLYQPAYENFATLLHSGSTDGWYKVLRTLCNDNEGVLTTEWTFATAIVTMKPCGITAVPVAADSQGMRSDDLRKVLSEWDDTQRGGMARPHVLYIVPVGDNPCGHTMGAARKADIYNICVEYDIIIVEDDPYYFLQGGLYVPEAKRAPPQILPGNNEDAAYLSALEPTFLKFDYQGRVIRLDSFSKTIAPGCRLGWYTCNTTFAERLDWHIEISSQSPCGFSQGLVEKLLSTWGADGYTRWLRALSKHHALRRDYFIDCLFREFAIRRDTSRDSGREGYVYLASEKRTDPATPRAKKDSSDARVLFSFSPPTSGMFIWIKIHLESACINPAAEDAPETRLWATLAAAGVVVAPGWHFSPSQVVDPRQAHIRISFCACELSEMKKAVSIMGRVLREFFKSV